jgi:hypothetical protein
LPASSSWPLALAPRRGQADSGASRWLQGFVAPQKNQVPFGLAFERAEEGHTPRHQDGPWTGLLQHGATPSLQGQATSPHAPNHDGARNGCERHDAARTRFGPARRMAWRSRTVASIPPAGRYSSKLGGGPVPLAAEYRGSGDRACNVRIPRALKPSAPTRTYTPRTPFAAHSRERPGCG